MKYEDSISIERTFKMRMRRVGNPKSFFAITHAILAVFFPQHVKLSHKRLLYQLCLKGLRMEEAGFRRCKKMRRTKIFESLPNYYHNMDLSRTPRTISMMMICPCNLIMVQREFSNSKDYKLRTLNLKEFSFQT